MGSSRKRLGTAGAYLVSIGVGLGCVSNCPITVKKKTHVLFTERLLGSMREIGVRKWISDITLGWHPKALAMATDAPREKEVALYALQ